MASTAEIAKATQREVKLAFDVLEAVHNSNQFQQLLDDLWKLQPGAERHLLVRDVVNSDERLESYGIAKDGDVTLQRTYFDDDRATLMALVYHLPKNLGFEKVTITYDDTGEYLYEAENPARNPFKEGIAEYRMEVEELAGSEQVVSTVLALPENPDERLQAVRSLTPDNLAGKHIPALRVAARWFEHEAPMSDSTVTPYVYVDGYPAGNPGPKPKPFPKPVDWTICGSLGKIACVSVGK